MKRFVYLAVAILPLAVGLWYALEHHRSAASDQLPANMQELKQRPGGTVTVDAGEFLIGLAKEGKLPGFALNEHGTMHAGILDANANTAASTEAEKYPLSRTIHFSKEGDTSDYFFVVVRESPGSAWKIQNAWRVDPDGRVLERYAVSE